MVNISSCNGLLPDHSNPLPEPVMIYHHQGLWHLFQGNVFLKTEDVNLKVVFEIYAFEITATSAKRQWVITVFIFVQLQRPQAQPHAPI